MENKITLDALLKVKDMMKQQDAPVGGRTVLLRETELNLIMAQLLKYEILQVKCDLLLKENEMLRRLY